MTDDTTDQTPTQAQGGYVDIHHLSQPQLARLGLSQIAYVRPITVDGAPGFAICAADGTQMAIMGDQPTALAAIVQHDMIPLLVH